MSDADDSRVLSLLRTKGLSVRSLDQESRELVRSYLTRVHLEKGVSLSDLAKAIGNKSSGYTSWLCKQVGVQARPFEEARLRGIREKRRKYERKPFDGKDEDRAYLLGLRHGDLTVSIPWSRVIRVSTSTTHPAMVELFRDLFSPHGHVYQLPRYKKDTRTYEWNVQVILDDSFSFLLQLFPESRYWLEESRERIACYLSGFLDAEGSILTTRNNRGGVVVFVDYFNENRTLLEWIEARLKEMGLGSSLRLNKPVGVGKTGYRLNHNHEYWQLSAFGARTIQSFIRELRLRHPEKLARRNIALSVTKNESYVDVYPKVFELRSRIKKDVENFVVLAEKQYLARHPPIATGQ